MAVAWSTKRVLITVRTYPVPARSTIEASCTAGVTRDHEWVRLFPIPYRSLNEDNRFARWQWVDVEAVRPRSDPRPESLKLKPDKIQIIGKVGTRDGWRERREILKPLVRPSMCHIKRERDENKYPTLGLFRPSQIKQLKIEPTDGQWTAGELSILRTDTFFQKAPARTLEKIPFDFKYEFSCSDSACRGHEMTCTDWEVCQAYRRWRRKYGENWEKHFRQKFETDMIQKCDTHFFVGTHSHHPGTWMIVGLFYPPKQQMCDLLDLINHERSSY
jgi:hypothetical protein